METLSTKLAPRQSLFRDADYFSKWIRFKEEVSIPKRIAQANNPGPNPKNNAHFVFKIFIECYELLIEKYSRGDDLNQLRSMFPEIITSWRWALDEEQQAFTPEEMAKRKSFALNFDFYVVCLWMVSLAICLEIDDDLLQRMLTIIGNEGEDALFERLVSTRIKGRKQADKGLHSAAYGELITLTADPASDLNGARLKRCVDRWYGAMKNTYWHDCHLGKDGGGYFGYWCFEAAAVAKAFNIDDNLVRDNPYYPKDLAAFRLDGVAN